MIEQFKDQGYVILRDFFSRKEDLSLFYECPELAADLLCNNDK